MTRALLFGAALLAAAAGTGCRSLPDAAAANASDTPCLDGSFHGRFDPGDEGGATRRLRVFARACRTGAVHLEVRGSVGGIVLTATVRDDRVLLVLPRERRAVTGPADSRALWETETGLPFDGALLRELFAAPPDEAVRDTRLGPWSVRLERVPGERFPARLGALHDDGMRVELARRGVREAGGPVAPPEIPDDFLRIDYDR